MPHAAFELVANGDHDGLARALPAAGKNATAARNFAFRAKRYGATDPFALLEQVAGYKLGGLAGRIRTPILIINPDDEQFWPGQSRTLFDQLDCDKRLVRTELRTRQPISSATTSACSRGGHSSKSAGPGTKPKHGSPTASPPNYCAHKDRGRVSASLAPPMAGPARSN